MQKEDLDTPGDDRTIVTMDYMASFFFPHLTLRLFLDSYHAPDRRIL